MTDVDLTRTAAGAPSNVLDYLGPFQLELYGGSEFKLADRVVAFDNLVFTGPPQLRRLDPISGRPGTSVILEGFGFGAAQGSGFVSLGSATMAVQSWSDTRITALVPPGAALGAQALSLTTNAGEKSAVLGFSVVDPRPGLLEELFEGAALDPAVWGVVANGGNTAAVSNGFLELRHGAQETGSFKGMAVHSRSTFTKAGVHHLHFDWLPGTKTDSNGRVSALFLRDAASPRFSDFTSGSQSPSARYLRLDLGKASDKERRGLWSLFGHGAEEGAAFAEELSSAPVASVFLDEPFLTAPDPRAKPHHVHIAVDFEEKTLRLEVDGRAVMPRVELGRRISGEPTSFLDHIRDFAVEFYGGSQFLASSWVESFDNVFLHAAEVIVDTTPPSVALELAEGAVISRPRTVSAQAADAGGLGAAVFFVGGVAQSTVPAPPYAFFWDTRNFPDGSHILSVLVRDKAGNAASASRSVTLNYAPPAPPVIASPADGFATRVPTITVSGTAEPGTTVQVLVNGLDAATALAIGGSWSVVAPLPGEGDITLAAVAFEARGLSSPSAQVRGLFATTPPNPPLFPTAEPRPVGRALILWSPPSGRSPSFYRLYRSTAGASLSPGLPAPAARRTADNIRGAAFEDFPGPEGLYFYGLTAVDLALNESVLSELAEVRTDAGAPRGAMLFSTPQPVGPGLYKPQLSLSEPPAEPPMLTFTPNAGQPSPLDLEPITATLWRATLTVTSAMNAGQGSFAFQGKDLAGNVGTTLSNAALLLDTRGPVGALALSKPSPVGPGSLGLSLELDEPAVSTPSLAIIPEGRSSVPISLSAASPESRSWAGTLSLAAATGDGLARTLYSASDRFGNTSALLLGSTAFVIDTQPPGPPLSIRANPLPGGKILVTWSAPFGERPAFYDVYRDGIKLSTQVFPAPDGTGAFLDIPAEGLHQYQISSVDLAGNESGLSDPSAVADALPPPPPVNLSAKLNAFEQVELTWEAASTDTARFRLYRSTFSLSAVEGLPLRGAVSPFVDSPAEDGTYHYVVTALDEVGNESGPSGEAVLVYDKAPPRIEITGVREGEFLNRSAAITFAAFDANLAPGSPSARLDGAPFASGASVSAEAAHALVVTASDIQGHASTRTISFTIDKTPPGIAFAGIEPGAVLFATASVRISVSELNPASSFFLLANHALGSTTPYRSGDPILRDGAYTLLGEARDLAGNVTTASLSFRLDVAPGAVLALSVRLEGAARLSWIRPEPDVLAYRVYKDGRRISSSLHPEASFEDSSYAAGTAAAYEVSAVDGLGSEGPRSRATVPAASLALAPLVLTRGFFDAIRPMVRNAEASALAMGPALLEVLTSAGVVATATAPAVSIPAGQVGTFEGVVATPASLPSPAAIRAAASLPTEPGVSVVLAGTFQVQAVEPRQPILEVFPDALVAGAEATVQVRFYNRGSASLDIVTAQVVDGQIREVADVEVRLRTPEGLLFASGGLKQTAGASASFREGRQVFFLAVPPQASVLFEPARVLVPNTILNALLVEAAVSTPTHGLAFQGLKGPRDFSNALSQAVVREPAYRAAVEPERFFYDQGEPVRLLGNIINAEGFGVAGASVSVHVLQNGFDRHVSTVSDATGALAVSFLPMPEEAGLYVAYAAHPDVLTHAAQSSFTIVGYGFEPASLSARLAQNSSLRALVRLRNTGATAVEALRASTSVAGGAGIALRLDAGALPSRLEAGESAELGLEISASPMSSSAAAVLAVSEAHGFVRSLPIAVEVFLPQAIPSAGPQAIEMGLLAGETREQLVTLKNLGFETWRGVALSCPTLEWASLTGRPELGDIAPGENANFAVRFAPPAGLASGSFARNPLIEVFSLNASTLPINAGIVVTSSRQGGLLFNIINADKPRDSSGQGAPVAGATVRLASQELPGLAFTASADLNGLARFGNAPAGGYFWSVTASGFQARSGSAVVEPGLNRSLEILMVTATISYDWSVTPTTVTDHYDVLLSLTFKTDVPAPIVILDPTAVTITADPHVETLGQFTVTNKGLVSAFEVNLAPESPDGEVAIELAFSTIPELKPRQTVAVPYKITHGQLAAGVAHCHQAAIQGVYGYTCAAGSKVNGKCEPLKITIGTACPGPGSVSIFLPSGAVAGAVFAPSVPQPWIPPHAPSAPRSSCKAKCTLDSSKSHPTVPNRCCYKCLLGDLSFETCGSLDEFGKSLDGVLVCKENLD